MTKRVNGYPLNYLKNPTCRYFNGYHPCPIAIKYHTACPCAHHKPIGKKLLVIEMGGIGSVLRTTVVTKNFKRIYTPSHITFLTHKDGIEVLKYSPSVDMALAYKIENCVTLLAETFDFIYNFEVDPAACSLCSLIQAKKKYGFKWNKNALPGLAHPESADLFRFQVDNQIRTKNQKSIQQLLIEAVGMEWQEQEFDIQLEREDRAFANNFFQGHKLDNLRVVGLNLGSKKIHAKKRWPIEYFIDLTKRLNDIDKVKPILLGGPEEIEIYSYAKSRLKSIGIIGNECKNTIGEFLALISRCEVIVSATTFGLLAATGLGVKTVAICSPKPISEVYTYGKGIKVAYSPTYDPEYSTKIKNLTLGEELKIGLKEIPVEMVLEAVIDSLKNDFSNPTRFV